MRAFKTTAVTAVLALAAACTTVNPYTNEQQTSKATKGAAIGAATGAVIGLVSGNDAVDRRQKALIGAGVGAIAGGSIGYYMDVEEAKLREKLQGTGVSVTRIGDNITLNMPSNVTFATNSSALNADFFKVLDSVALVVDEYDKTLVEVAGYTDSTGPDDFNMRLSDDRARAVASYLESQGVLALRLIPIGLGETMPVASNDTTEGRSLNRRVELTLVPIVDK